MIITITLILCSLVALNFLLLIFSCNKTEKKEPIKNQVIISPTPKKIKVAKPMQKLATASQLAPTGS